MLTRLAVVTGGDGWITFSRLFSEDSLVAHGRAPSLLRVRDTGSP